MTQTRNGNAFEYACVLAAETVFSKNQPVQIVSDNHLQMTKVDFLSLTPQKQNVLKSGAIQGMKTIQLYETNLSGSSRAPLIVKLNSAASGERGDVRDILLQKPDLNWEIGISSKHNHDAVKHSRLSESIDFGQKWLGYPTPRQYFENLAPIWKSLRMLRAANERWENVEKKEEIYERVLQEFVSALECIARDRSRYDTAANFLKYLIGRHDFYKIMLNVTESTTSVQAFNQHGSLHRGENHENRTHLSTRFPIPNDFVRIKHASYNRAEVLLEKNWAVGMRIHSASTRVEPSLKFDIRLEGIPSTLQNIVSPWES